jgi:hypothetical protein
MTNYLDQVNQAIINDPHGSVAREASHWLAVEVMGWELVAVGFDWYFATLKEGAEDNNLPVNYRLVMSVGDWQPFTDANHTRMLVIHYSRTFGNVVGLKPYSDDTTHDARQVLNKCHAEGKLTDDTLKGWLEND